MTDNQSRPPEGQGFDPAAAFDSLQPYLHPGKQNVMLTYVLYLAGVIPAFGLVPIIIGLVMALINRPNATGPWASHYEYQIRQALYGLIYLLVSFVLVFVLIGFLGILATAIWWIVRSIKGIQAASNAQLIASPQTWGW
jgi:uncharacterized membrane protein